MKVLEDEPVSAGYTYTSWYAVIHPAPPCSWHAFSILNLNYPACMFPACMFPACKSPSYTWVELATQRFLGCCLQVMSQPSILRCNSGSSSLAHCHTKTPLTAQKKSGWIGRDLPLVDPFPAHAPGSTQMSLLCAWSDTPKAKYPATGPSSNVNKVKLHSLR